MSDTTQRRYDAVVIGAGNGGMAVTCPKYLYHKYLGQVSKKVIEEVNNLPNVGK